jgi:lysophospholipase L1-like esterase
MKGLLSVVMMTGLLTIGVNTSHAELPWQFTEHTRYMVMGDSLGSGYGAIPQTNGYAYQLYHSGVFDKVPQTLFCNASVIGVTSADVLANQVPQAFVFRPDVVTLTVGGNDLAKIMEGADPQTVLAEFQDNLTKILYALVIELNAKVYIANLYVIEAIPQADFIVPLFNNIVSGVASGFGDVSVADLYSQFQGKQGLLLIERNDAAALEIHPSNAGHTAIAKAFIEVSP